MTTEFLQGTVMVHHGWLRSKAARFFCAAAALLWSLVIAAPAAHADPAQGPGGPILVVTSGTPTFGTYYAEILRTEGLNAFTVADIATVTPEVLAQYDVVLLSKMALNSDKVTVLSNWVSGGGNLIAMAPDTQLAGLLGLAPVGSTLSNGYLLVNTSASPGNGIVNQTIQFHGAADLYTLNGATAVATLYSTANTATINPAVTLRSAGLGKAAAFTYDLASSVVYTRQGNPAWAAEERDGFAPIRSDDKFFGAKTGDVQADWVDLNKVAIPQADEQQRLLANLIIHMNSGKKPLPRFWYFPNGKKAVVIMTGDDHGNGGTIGRFEQFKSLSTPGCSVANWECIRGTSYMYTETPMSDAQASQYKSEGFEVGIHIYTDRGCANYDLFSLQATYLQQVAEFQLKYPSALPLRTQRHHCIAWSDWSSGAEVQFAYGMRLDTSYYYWPPSWVNGVPGLFTGSAMPMRFAKLDGSFVDVFQAATQMTDESGQAYPYTVNTLLDRALGEEGYYGAYTVNAHTDVATIIESDTVVASAQARGVPVITAQQMLTWLDARNASSFGAFGFNAGVLTFSVTKDPAANGLQGMLPLRAGNQLLTGLTRNGNAATITTSAIKGMEYALFAADGGTYAATYAADVGEPQVVSTTPAASASGVATTARPTVTFGEAMDPSTINGATLELRNASNTIVNATVTYNAAIRTATLAPASPLAESAVYTVTVRGGAADPRVKDAAGNALSANFAWSFTTAAGPVCPCGGWGSSATPATPSVNDPGAVELGVKFTSDVSGFVTGVRFYKGVNNTGTHIGNLWAANGTQLASATFTGETTSGWQEVSFATPVAITAGTVYVASYFAPNGNYAADSQFFASTGVNNPPIRLLSDPASGGNGVYAYGSASSFPSSSFQATNYWVDVVFNTVGPTDTTPPTVTSTSPASGATGIATAATVLATFSEAVDPASVTAANFQVSGPSSTAVPGVVTYDGATRTARFTPSSALAASTAYSVTVKGGSSGVKDLAGNALAADVTWSFTTGAASACPCGAWDPSAVPATPSANDPGAVELGVKFRSDVNGFVTGIRFYKGAGNTGTHIGSLWTTSGSRLATATFTAETASGWQQVDFASPVAITANTVYVASYFAPNGGYAADAQFFANSGVDKPPIRLLSNAAAGGNGVFAYGTASSFPNSTYQSTNYWVDVVFTTNGPPDTTPPTVASNSPAGGSTGVALGSAITASFSEALDPATVNTSTFEVVAPSTGSIAGTVAYNPAAFTATFTPAGPLAASTTYTVTLKGGGADPRIKDSAGNALAANVTWTFTTGVLGGACAAPANPIVAENCLTGNPASEWDISGIGDASIQGFATDISVNRGNTVSFKVNTNAANYRFDIYRMGYYGGLGARKVATVNPSAALPQTQPACLNDAATGLIDCGNWGVSGSWPVPANATSGIYFAKVVRNDTQGASHIFFIVRNDASTSDLLFQTSDTTWQAYNNYGGNSLYTGAPVGRAYKVSYNRPFFTRAVDNGQDWVFNAEYPMVRWLEANGYDVSYFSGVDADRLGSAYIRNHKTFVSVGHDEYWSGAQRTNVESARDNGVHLAFFSGNEIFWKTRWENSIDGSASTYRTLVSYKETTAGAKIDPAAAWTGTWRDPRFSPPADGGRPENALSGTIFQVNGGTTSILVPEADGKMRFWRNTSIANLAAGTTASLPNGTLGYEWDIDADNGFRPPGLIRLSSTTANGVEVLLDYGSTYGSGTANHALTLYRHASGARVFGAGTIQWSWGLDATHDRAGTPVDARMQQATVNLFADMGAQPATLQAGLVPATASTDAVAPTSTITSPAPGATVPQGNVTISGTASDTGGVVGGVEVSVDGGLTWRRANGRANWTFSWTPTATGAVTIRSRAADDSGNLEVPGAGINVTVAPQSCPCTIWSPSAVPTVVSDSDTGSVNLGVKFRADVDGFITGIRFYKGVANTGTHIGTLWTSGGAQLATATFTNETASGWQQVNFSSPVAITAGVVYVASYLAPNGRYAGDNNYFATSGVDNPPLHALQNGVSGGNGVYAYGAGTLFPASTFGSSNYWVDVVFTTSAPADTTPPTVTVTSPPGGTAGVGGTANVTATFSEALNATTVNSTTFELRDAGNALVAAVVTYDAVTRVATLNPTPTLTPAATYTATVKGGATDPRVKDAAGNALAANVTWSFTIAADTTAPTVTATTPASGATGVAISSAVTATFSEAMNASTISGTTFVLSASSGQVAAGVSYNSTTRVATLTPSTALATSTVYTATVIGGATGVTDSAGNPLAANRTWSFTTAGVDVTPPTVTVTAPLSGATGVSGTANVTATFSEAMDSATIGSTTFELRDPSNTVVAAVVSYNATTRVVTLNPTPTLLPATVYTATIKGGAADPRVKDAAGNALAANVTWSFTIAPDTTPPTVSSTSPANLATGINPTANITATFNEVMDLSTIGASTFELRDPGNNVVPAVVTYNTTTRVATLNPTPNLVGGTVYSATVRGGPTGVKDVAGNALAVDRAWTFTIETTPPTVTSTSPTSGATGISRTANITATFSEAMDPATVSTATVELRDPSNTLVPSVVTLSTNRRTVTLNPSPTLTALTTYTVTIKGGLSDPRVKDLAGNAVAINQTWSFTTN
jgi:Domain of unknown function (DUF4082)/Bacterial Ig-like domain/Bacterial Ig domain